MASTAKNNTPYTSTKKKKSRSRPETAASTGSGRSGMSRHSLVHGIMPSTLEGFESGMATLESQVKEIEASMDIADVNNLTPRSEFAMRKAGYTPADLRRKLPHEYKYSEGTTERTVEEYFALNNLYRALHNLRKARNEVIRKKLLDVKGQERAAENEMLGDIVKHENDKFDHLQNVYQRQFRLLVNDMKINLETLEKMEEKRKKEKQKQQRKEEERRQREEELREKRRKEKAKQQKILDEQQRRLDRLAMESVAWLTELKEEKARRRKAEQEHQQNIMRKTAKENEEYQKKMEEQNYRNFKRQQNQMDNILARYDKENRLWATRIAERVEFFHKSNSEAEQMHQKIMNDKKKDAARLRQLAKQLEEAEEARARALQEQKDHQRLMKKRSTDMHMKRIKTQAKMNTQNKMADIMHKQLEAEARRAEFQQEKAKRDAVKKSTDAMKRDTAIERIRQLRRARDFDNELTSQRFQRADDRYQRGKALEEFIQQQRLLQGNDMDTKLKEFLDNLEHAFQHGDMTKINNMRKQIEETPFEFEHFEVARLRKILDKLSSGPPMTNKKRPAPQIESLNLTKSQIKQEVYVDSTKNQSSLSSTKASTPVPAAP